MKGELSPNNPVHWFEQHGTAFGLGMSAGLLLVGYFGTHWINRRQFYRRKLRDPFPTYFKAWRTQLLEGNLGWFFLLCMVASPLFFIAGVAEWLDGQP